MASRITTLVLQLLSNQALPMTILELTARNGTIRVPTVNCWLVSIATTHRRQDKQYRPWDAKARAMRMPEPCPLYNLPAISAVDAVVLVKPRGP